MTTSAVFPKGGAVTAGTEYALAWCLVGQGGALASPDPSSATALTYILLAGMGPAVPTLQWLADGWNQSNYGTTSPLTIQPGSYFLAVIAVSP